MLQDIVVNSLYTDTYKHIYKHMYNHICVYMSKNRLQNTKFQLFNIQISTKFQKQYFCKIIFNFWKVNF